MARARNAQYPGWKGTWSVTVWLIGVLVLAVPASLWAGFEGFGASTPGGNNDPVTVVTSLANSGPGTLREALANGSHQRIVFAVGGTINLQSRLEIRGRAFITIDGSTAPGPGITLDGDMIYIRDSHDIILTHLRVRDSVSDGILVWNSSYNVVIDHCSVTNAADENINITEDTHDVTVSWCIMGDTRPNSFDLHSKGMLIANFSKPAVTNVSLHHNFFVNEFQRSPQVSTAGLFDIRNNVIWDWGSYGIRMRNGVWGNIINNVFSTNNNPGNALVLVSDAGPVHLEGNAGPGTTNINSLSTASSPFPVAPVSTDPITEVERKVLEGAGAFPRDTIDADLAGPANPDSNQPPVADAGAAQTVNVGVPVTLNGTGSSDPDDDLLTHSWNFGDGTTAVGAVVTHTYTAAGDYTVTLTVDDGELSDTDTAQISVDSEASPACGFANLARCATASASSVWSAGYAAAMAKDADEGTRWNSASGETAGAWLVLEFATSTTFDTIVLTEAFARITGYRLQAWTGTGWQDLVTGTRIGASQTHTFAPLTAQRIRLLVTSTISPGNTGTPTIYEFEVYHTSSAPPANQPPIADAGPAQTVPVEAPVTLSGTGSSDPEGDPLSYSWDFGDTSSGTGASVTHMYATAGSYVVTLTVNDGEWSATATVLITVTAEASPACGFANLARCATASASSVWSASYAAARATDADAGTRWNSASGETAGAWLALEFDAPTTFDTIVLKEAFARITGYRLQAWTGTGWQDLVTGTSIGASQTHTFAPLTAQRIRLLVTSTISPGNTGTPTIYEFEVYGSGG